MAARWMGKIREEEEHQHHGGLEIGREKRLNALLSFLVRAERSNIIIRVINHQNQKNEDRVLLFFQPESRKVGMAL